MFTGPKSHVPEFPSHSGFESRTSSRRSTMKPMMLYLSGGWLGKQVTGFPLRVDLGRAIVHGEDQIVPDPLFEAATSSTT